MRFQKSNSSEIKGKINMGGFEFNGTVAYGYQVPYEAFKVGQNEEDADKVDSEWAQDYLPECCNLFC